MASGGLPDPAGLLRQHGVQVTPQRVAVLRAVSSRPHGTAEDIEELARAQLGAVSHQTVYDAPGTLADEGLIMAVPGKGFVAHVQGLASAPLSDPAKSWRELPLPGRTRPFRGPDNTRRGSWCPPDTAGGSGTRLTSVVEAEMLQSVTSQGRRPTSSPLARSLVNLTRSLIADRVG